ncbi:kinase-like protein [Trametes gibbosa]|nr:kinase-like protein [Trametes gibbosa]
MAAQDTHKRVPRGYPQNPNGAESYMEIPTRTGAYDLIPSEVFWRERYRHLKEAGYVLRPRYTPDWKPSWADTEMLPNHREDSVMLMNHQIIDARRREDNERVAIKRVRSDTGELDIMKFLSAFEDDNTNHTVPLLAVLPDPFDKQLSLMVMPFLRPFDDPEFTTIGEVVEFIDQMVEPLGCPSHTLTRDIALANIMMDAKPLYTDGYHPVWLQYSEDISHVVAPLSRTGRSIRYFYIDFDLSIRFPDDALPYAVGDVGRDAEVPELSPDVPYDAFKVDIFALGNLLRKEFEQRYNSMEFLRRLIDPMTRRQPESRPTADQILVEWQSTRSELNESLFRWRLGPKSEPAIGRMFNDTVAVARRLVGTL